VARTDRQSGATASELADLRRRLVGVAGWLSDEEAETLFALAKRCAGRGVIVEIGSHQGRSTICLALGSRAGAGAPVHAIDPRKGRLLETFRQNLDHAGVADMVVTHVQRSADAHAEFPPDQPVELLFIDGAHTYDAAKLDFELWEPHVVDGGHVVMHDTIGFAGSRRVADEKLLRSGRFAGARFVPSTITVGRKVARATAGDRLRARWTLAVKSAAAAALHVRGKLPGRVERAGRAVLRRMG
jgi:predicted O-methyltransferase YrrM